VLFHNVALPYMTKCLEASSARRTTEKSEVSFDAPPLHTFRYKEQWGKNER